MDYATLIEILGSMVRLATPLLFACLAGLFSERAGIFDIGLEGKMLMAAMVSGAVAALTGSVWLGVLAGIGLDGTREPRSGAQSARRPILALVMTATLLVSVVAGVISGAMQIAPVADAHARSEAVADRLQDLPPGSMLVWGNQPVLYDLADRAPATVYSYLYPLTTPGYSTPDMVGTVARALADHPPAVVVDAGSTAPGQPGFLPLLIDRPVATDGRDLDLLGPLRAFVAGHYRLAATVAGWPIYVLRDEPAP